MPKNSRKKNILLPLIAFLLCAAALTLYSHSSPLYLMNTWEDVNGNLTIGKCIANGIVLYRDIFEQRGPLLYFLHTLAYWMSPNSFHGIWILELLFCAVFVCFVYKILSLYEREENIVFLPLLMVLIYSSRSYGLGGSPEEFCMPFLTASLYTLLKALKKGRMLNADEYIWIGFCSGAVLWIKYSMLGFYIGSVLPVLFLVFRRQGLKGFFRLVFGVLAGVCVISVPVFVYFVANQALKSLFHVYFYINMNYYPFNDSILYKLYFAGLGFLDAVVKNWQYWIVTALGLVQLFRLEKKPSVIVTLLFGAAGLAMVIYSGGQQFAYYALILSIYSIFGLLIIPKMNAAVKTGVFLAAAVCLGYLAMPKVNDRLHASEADYVQYRFARMMERNATLLNYQFLDGGFFFAADILPDQYYAWSFNVLNDEIRSEQNTYVKEARTAYIVSHDHDVEEADQNHQYELIAEEDGYCLYRRRNS